ncbi:ribosome-binding ATPase YchF (GTP1/OBG family) [Methanomicrobium sp. W14]|uniref:redox-regulated ATPase YchF n=1 Tax=Methanomicrobium sp. W14 TaxID=2817839 RepID=UPI001AE86F03|nr:redox-regulated ATPase YchF [Methanomicrobium sp. W14]MBP2134585.1 ribosome-binding ATPase YchF (GTP1/OBG family) [Methanomicrobium sp. W14]
MINLAIAGKPNCGKSTFFSAATMAPAEIANYPFTTIDANNGVAYVRINCACKELGIQNCPACKDGVRFVPVGLIDVAGLVPEAYKGRGLGNKFLDNLREADAIIHIIDGSGSTDEEGNPVENGSHDPASDIGFVEEEMKMWVYGLLERNWHKIQRSAQQKNYSIENTVADQLAGLSMTPEHVAEAVRRTDISLKTCTEEELINFCGVLVEIAKPFRVVANKADCASKELLEKLKNENISFSSAAGELALRKASEAGLISYVPGDPDFTINEPEKLNKPQKTGLDAIKKVMNEFGGTGVQQTINGMVFDLLDMIVVFPVEDENKFCDGKDRILPDAYLMKRGSTPHDLAYHIHSDIGDGFLYAVDAKTKMRIKENHILKSGDVIKIVSTKK